jgi:hypothetical protein
MLSSTLTIFLALFSVNPAFAVDGCAPNQVCTYKGVLKAGQACPASFCQGSSYYDGVAASANGKVLKILKEKPSEVRAPEKAADWVDPPKAAVWKDPPAKAKAPVGNLPSMAAVELKIAECRKSERPFAELSLECKTLLNLDALAIKPADGESFCRATFAGDETGFARCMGQDQAPEIKAGTVYRQVLRNRVGSTEQLCRRRFGSDEEAFQQCVSTRAVTSQAAVAGSVKVAPASAGSGSGAASDGAGTSMSVDSAD